MFPYLGIEILRSIPPGLREIGGVAAMRFAGVMPKTRMDTASL
jgi:transcriptional regulator of aromatic amino acid metabolism